MPPAPPRRLKLGDEAIAEAACRRFGLAGDLDARSFLSRPQATLMVVEVDDRVRLGGLMATSWSTQMESARCSYTLLISPTNTEAEATAQLSSGPLSAEHW